MPAERDDAPTTVGDGAAAAMTDQPQPPEAPFPERTVPRMEAGDDNAELFSTAVPAALVDRFAERPEIFVGGAFLGGLVAAQILRRVRRG